MLMKTFREHVRTLEEAEAKEPNTFLCEAKYPEDNSTREMPLHPPSFWSGKHPLHHVAQELHKRIPKEGSVPGAKGKNKHLEHFRKAQNAYYDLHNNGLMNRAHEFNHAFNVRSGDYRMKNPRHLPYARNYHQSLYHHADREMENIVKRAADEQGIKY